MSKRVALIGTGLIGRAWAIAFARGGFVHGEDFARYCLDAFDWLWREGARTPKMMSVGLRLRIIGHPGRIGGLERFLTAVTSRPQLWIARRDAIAHH